MLGGTDVRIMTRSSHHEILGSLEVSKLRHSFVRKTILQTFLYQDFDTGVLHAPDPSAPSDVGNLK